MKNRVPKFGDKVRNTTWMYKENEADMIVAVDKDKVILWDRNTKNEYEVSLKFFKSSYKYISSFEHPLTKRLPTVGDKVRHRGTIYDNDTDYAEILLIANSHDAIAVLHKGMANWISRDEFDKDYIYKPRKSFGFGSTKAMPKEEINDAKRRHEADIRLIEELLCKPKVCECGSTKIGSHMHSAWCPLHEGDKR